MKLRWVSTLSFVIIFMALAISSCTKNTELKDNDAKSKQALVGVWRGEGGYENEEDAGWSEFWRMAREANGKYSVEYLIVHDEDKLFEQSSDKGTWSYENGVYYEVNARGDKTTYDVYSVKEDWFEYNIAERQGSANIQETKTVESFRLQEPPEEYTKVAYEQSLDQLPLDPNDGVDVEEVINAIEQAVSE